MKKYTLGHIEYLNRTIFQLLLIASSILCTQQASAHAWVANAPAWSRSYAEAFVPGDSEITDSGVTLFGQSTATAQAQNADAAAYAHAHSIGLWGGNVKTTAQGPGALAGPSNPFTTPIMPGIGDGNAELDFLGSVTGNLFSLNGTASHNTNGFLELSVINLGGLSEQYVSDIFLLYGSVESALAANYLDSWRVLLNFRETSLADTFTYEIDLGMMSPDDIVVTGLSHAVSHAPEPSALILFGLGGLMLAVRRSRKNLM